MTWRDLIADKDEAIVLPWIGGRSLHFDNQTRRIEGALPLEQGWYQFLAKARKAILVEEAEPEPERLIQQQSGFLVGNRFVPDDAQFSRLDEQWTRRFSQVHLLAEGLDRFSRIEVGRVFSEGPLIFKGLAYPLGPEDEVLTAFLDKETSLSPIKGVIPSLQAAFDLESYERFRAEQRRADLERLRREEAARIAAEERRQELYQALGTGAGRREMATIDFHGAAAAALAVGGAELLDLQEGRGGEKVVRYRLDGRRYECICDAQMRIIDAGVCLTDEKTGEKGDTFFTLESLPAVIRQAAREGVLVIYRHV